MASPYLLFYRYFLNLEDLAILTGSQLVSEDLGMKLDKVDLSMLGSAKKVKISNKDQRKGISKRLVKNWI